MRQLTPPEQLVAAGVGLARTMQRAVLDFELRHRDIGAACDVSKQEVGRWLCLDKPDRAPALLRVALMPRPLALAVLRFLAGHHGAEVVDRIEGDSVTTHLERLTSMISHGAEVQAEYAAAIADGVIDEAERRRLIEVIEVDIRRRQGVLTDLRRESIRAVRDGVAS